MIKKARYFLLTAFSTECSASNKDFCWQSPVKFNPTHTRAVWRSALPYVLWRRFAEDRNTSNRVCGLMVYTSNLTVEAMCLAFSLKRDVCIQEIVLTGMLPCPNCSLVLIASYGLDL